VSVPIGMTGDGLPVGLELDGLRKPGDCWPSRGR